MARASFELIDALRKTAKKISVNKDGYNWKAIGACNCGNLVQVVTGYSAKQISDFGIKKHGDWRSISQLYSKESEYEIDKIISKLVDMGMELEEFSFLENLDSPEVLSFINKEVNFQRDDPDHAVEYINAWAEMLEDELAESITLEKVSSRMIEA